MDMTPADYAAINHDDGMFGGNGIWFLALLFLFGGGFGYGTQRGNVATTEDLASGFNFSSVGNRLNDIIAGQANINQNLGNAICSLGYETAQQINTVERQLADCCCATQRAIDSVKFDMANYSAATNATITAGIQKVLDKMCADQTAALQARVQTLEMQQALCGVVRYPTTTAYAVPNPCFGYSGCGNCAY